MNQQTAVVLPFNTFVKQVRADPSTDNDIWTEGDIRLLLLGGLKVKSKEIFGFTITQEWIREHLTKIAPAEEVEKRARKKKRTLFYKQKHVIELCNQLAATLRAQLPG